MKKIYLAFLWHQHQPIYKDPITGVYELPWVRLHATKDYYDTAVILENYPKLKSNFNLVPSLLTQLDEYSKGTAKDKFMDLTLKKASELNEDERVFILENFFMANKDNMIYPYPRYAKLLEKRGETYKKKDLKRLNRYFSEKDITDLQVWFNLTWMDPYWRKNDRLVGTLYEKGEGFTEEEKKQLIDKQLEICSLVSKKYKELQDNGQIELSVTPFYHPILPLLYDTNICKMANPSMPLPEERFSYPIDAETQIKKAVNYYKDTFGIHPNGMWPSEGSVSKELIPLFSDSQIKWIATDEGILFNTKKKLERLKLYQPYIAETDGKSVNMIFRDHGLSDAIGFVYTRWHYKNAVEDFIKNIKRIKHSLSHSKGSHIVPVILDGENCWEHYANDGWDFLSYLYQELEKDPEIETVRINDFLEKNPPKDVLNDLWAGSWINSNFGIWIGHREDNTSWTYLARARKFLDNYVAEHPGQKDSDSVKKAFEYIYMAEGSDWNWWYGDDHSSENDAMFDAIYRNILSGVYQVLGETPPEYLKTPIKGKKARSNLTEPLDYITPIIDGRISDYYEWKYAGVYKTGLSGGAMHQIDTILKAFMYGFDKSNFYMRFDLNKPLKGNIDNISIIADFSVKGGGKSLKIDMTKDNPLPDSFSINGEPCNTIKAKNIIELSVPLNKLFSAPDDVSLEFNIKILIDSKESEIWPDGLKVKMDKPNGEFKSKNWSV